MLKEKKKKKRSYKLEKHIQTDSKRAHTKKIPIESHKHTHTKCGDMT